MPHPRQIMVSGLSPRDLGRQNRKYTPTAEIIANARSMRSMLANGNCQSCGGYIARCPYLPLHKNGTIVKKSQYIMARRKVFRRLAFFSLAHSISDLSIHILSES
jgi:hypothetical protein